MVLLHFKKGTREAFHDHAFNALTIWLKGIVLEHEFVGPTRAYCQGMFKITRRSMCHKLQALTSTWAISFRGPWLNEWHEVRGEEQHKVTLTHGRRIVEQ